jgi:hypothetical protein
MVKRKCLTKSQKSSKKNANATLASASQLLQQTKLHN